MTQSGCVSLPREYSSAPNQGLVGPSTVQASSPSQPSSSPTHPSHLRSDHVEQVDDLAYPVDFQPYHARELHPEFILRRQIEAYEEHARKAPEAAQRAFQEERKRRVAAASQTAPPPPTELREERHLRLARWSDEDVVHSPPRTETILRKARPITKASTSPLRTSGLFRPTPKRTPLTIDVDEVNPSIYRTQEDSSSSSPATAPQKVPSDPRQPLPFTSLTRPLAAAPFLSKKTFEGTLGSPSTVSLQKGPTRTKSKEVDDRSLFQDVLGRSELDEEEYDLSNRDDVGRRPAGAPLVWSAGILSQIQEKAEQLRLAALKKKERQARLQAEKELAKLNSSGLPDRRLGALPDETARKRVVVSSSQSTDSARLRPPGPPTAASVQSEDDLEHLFALPGSAAASALVAETESTSVAARTPPPVLPTSRSRSRRARASPPAPAASTSRPVALSTAPPAPPSTPPPAVDESLDFALHTRSTEVAPPAPPSQPSAFASRASSPMPVEDLNELFALPPSNPSRLLTKSSGRSSTTRRKSDAPESGPVEAATIAVLVPEKSRVKKGKQAKGVVVHDVAPPPTPAPKLAVKQAVKEVSAAPPSPPPSVATSSLAVESPTPTSLVGEDEPLEFAVPTPPRRVARPVPTKLFKTAWPLSKKLSKTVVPLAVGNAKPSTTTSKIDVAPPPSAAEPEPTVDDTDELLAFASPSSLNSVEVQVAAPPAPDEKVVAPSLKKKEKAKKRQPTTALVAAPPALPAQAAPALELEFGFANSVSKKARKRFVSPLFSPVSSILCVPDVDRCVVFPRFCSAPLSPPPAFALKSETTAGGAPSPHTRRSPPAGPRSFVSHPVALQPAPVLSKIASSAPASGFLDNIRNFGDAFQNGLVAQYLNPDLMPYRAVPLPEAELTALQSLHPLEQLKASTEGFMSFAIDSTDRSRESILSAEHRSEELLDHFLPASEGLSKGEYTPSVGPQEISAFDRFLEPPKVVPATMLVPHSLDNTAYFGLSAEKRFTPLMALKHTSHFTAMEEEHQKEYGWGGLYKHQLEAIEELDRLDPLIGDRRTRGLSFEHVLFGRYKTRTREELDVLRPASRKVLGSWKDRRKTLDAERFRELWDVEGEVEEVATAPAEIVGEETSLPVSEDSLLASEPSPVPLPPPTIASAPPALPSTRLSSTLDRGLPVSPTRLSQKPLSTDVMLTFAVCLSSLISPLPRLVMPRCFLPRWRSSRRRTSFSPFRRTSSPPPTSCLLRSPTLFLLLRSPSLPSFPRRARGRRPTRSRRPSCGRATTARTSSGNGTRSTSARRTAASRLPLPDVARPQRPPTSSPPTDST